jgi:hypothetical protein
MKSEYLLILQQALAEEALLQRSKAPQDWM